MSPGDRSGWSVSSAGDFNKDGYDDIIIGAPNANSITGTSYLIFGKASGFTDIDLSSDLATSNVGFKVYIYIYTPLLQYYIYLMYNLLYHIYYIYTYIIYYIILVFINIII